MDKYNFYKPDTKKVLKALSKETLLGALKEMILIRVFETRAESAYQHGLIGGFFHAYTGQEAIQTGCIHALGKDHWYATTYRCHALALLLGVNPNDLMSELYGRANGNAQGRGGSMHLYTDRLLGGFGIVGGHLPVSTGAAFSIKYKNQKDKLSLCFLGEGASVQGTFHESLNLASLWNLPCIYVIENNKWGMGTASTRAICVEPVAEHFAKAYGVESYTLNGTDFLQTYAAFKEIGEKVIKTQRPIIVEAVAERFRGHSISDPGLYRSKEHLEEAKKGDPITILFNYLKAEKMIDDAGLDALNKEAKEIVVAAMEHADKSPWPDPLTLEEGVYA